MRPVSPLLIGLFLACTAAALAVDPVPESEQATQARKIIDAYHGTRPADPPRKLHVVYFTPADREPADNYETRLNAILEDIRAFYRDGMDRLGFGPRTFTLPRDGQGKLVIHLVKSKDVSEAFPRWKGRNGGNTGDPAAGDMVMKESKPVLEAAGISFNRETVLVFCHLARYDAAARTFRHHSPYFGSWSQQSGLCFAADWAEQDLQNLTRKTPRLNDGEYGDMTLGKHTTIFIGGIAHELGHAFALPHCGERWDEKPLGTSLLGGGNHTYREEQRGEGKGSFLTMASAMRLAARPLFNGSDKGEPKPGQVQTCSLTLSTNVTSSQLAGRKGALRLEGTVTGSPPIYGVVAYFDSRHDGGYRAPTATSVPDSQGRFAIEVSDLTPCSDGDLRVEFCHANGAVSERRFGFAVASDGCVDLAQWQMRQALEPVAAAVGQNNLKAARAALAQLENTAGQETAKDIGRKLVGTLLPEARPHPATAPATLTRLPLGEARPQVAEVGWLQPAANRIPANSEIPSPLLDSGNLFATGLYAHSPSRYVYDLGGKWKRLRGKAGLHTFHRPHGTVIFVIKTDGKEAFRSPVIQGPKMANYSLDLTGVKTLELIVEKASERNGGNWGLWLEPTLSRDEPGGRAD
ncbi:MAG TPA: NPCBM/NEW2 domain-containing protein [Clostridia bacterium]|nr:NPCBM/NEW2 domain-containing protein [Clostridia bacterium]